MKLVDVKDNMFFNFGKEVNDKGPKFQVGDHVRILSTKTLLQKAILQIGLKKFL